MSVVKVDEPFCNLCEKQIEDKSPAMVIIRAKALTSESSSKCIVGAGQRRVILTGSPKDKCVVCLDCWAKIEEMVSR